MAPEQDQALGSASVSCLLAWQLVQSKHQDSLAPPIMTLPQTASWTPVQTRTGIR